MFCLLTVGLNKIVNKFIELAFMSSIQDSQEALPPDDSQLVRPARSAKRKYGAEAAQQKTRDADSRIQSNALQRIEAAAADAEPKKKRQKKTHEPNIQEAEKVEKVARGERAALVDSATMTFNQATRLVEKAIKAENWGDARKFIHSKYSKLAFSQKNRDVAVIEALPYEALTEAEKQTLVDYIRDPANVFMTGPLFQKLPRDKQIIETAIREIEEGINFAFLNYLAPASSGLQIADNDEKLLKKHLKKAVEIDTESYCINKIFHKNLDPIQIAYVLETIKEIINESPTPLAAHIVALQRMIANYNSLMSQAVNHQKTTSQVWSTVCFIEKTLQKADHVFKDVYPSTETGGLPIVREKGALRVVHYERVWKDKTVRVLSETSDLKKPFMRIVTKTAAAWTKPAEAFAITAAQSDYLLQFKEALKLKNLALHRQLFSQAVTNFIPWNILYNTWMRDYEGTAILEHQKEFFAIAFSALSISSISPGAKQEQYAHLTALAKDFENPSLNRLMEQVASTLKEVENKPKVQDFSLRMLSRVFAATLSGEVLSIEVVEEYIGALLYMLDTNRDNVDRIQWVDSSRAIKSLLMQFFDTYPEIGKLTLFEEEEQAVAFENQYAFKIAALLFRPNGTINDWSIHRIKESLFSRSSPFYTNITTILSQIQENPRLREILQAVEAPPSGSVGEKIVRTSLNLASTATVTSLQAKQCVLASMLGYWRQYKFGSCHTTSLLHTTRHAALEWEAADLAELMKTGAITRSINGKKVAFMGIAKTVPYALHKVFSIKKVDKFVSELKSCPSLARAFGLSSATDVQIKEAIESLKAQEKPCSLFSIIQKLKEMLALSDQVVQDILWEAGTATEMPLTRVLENAAMSMQSAPLAMRGMETIQRSNYEKLLLGTFETLAETNPRLHQRVIRDIGSSVSDMQGADAFNKLRLFAEPPDNPDEIHARFILYRQTASDAFERITTEEGCGKLLQDIFTELYGEPLTASNQEIARVFKTKFHTYFENHNAQDSGMNFQLRHFYEIPLFATYLKADLSTSHFKEINFQDPPSVAIGKILKWAESARIMVGKKDKDVGIPAWISTHVFRMTPNHPSLFLPEGKAVGAWLDEKVQVMRELGIGNCQTASEYMLRAVAMYFKEKDATLTESKLEELVNAKRSEQGLDSTALTVQQWSKIALEVAQACNNNTPLPESALKTFDEFCIEGICTDQSDEVRSQILLHFADTNWVRTKDSTTLPKYFSFTINPRTLEWQVVSTTEKGWVFSFEKFSKISIFSGGSQLKTAAHEKQLFTTRSALRHTLIQCKTDFYKDLKIFLAEKNRCTADKKRTAAQLIAASSTPQELKEKLSSTYSLGNFGHFLKNLLYYKTVYQEALNDLCKDQESPVDQLLQEIFVTHFEAPSEATELLDADPDTFLQKLATILQVPPKSDS